MRNNSFHDGAFDLVLSQFALMFVADKAAGLAVRRVVTPSGRVLISVWQGLDRHPFYQTLHKVIQQRLGMSALQGIFALGMQTMCATEHVRLDFERADIKPFSLTARFPNPEAFIAGEIEVDGSAIPSMQHLDSKRLAKIVKGIARDMQSPLKELIFLY